MCPTRTRHSGDIAVDGGNPVIVCSVDAIPFGVSWDATGILFEADGSIMRVPADGGKPETLIASSTSDRVRNPRCFRMDGPCCSPSSLDRQYEEYCQRRLPGANCRAADDVQRTSTRAGFKRDGGTLSFDRPPGVRQPRRAVCGPFDVRSMNVTGGPMALVRGVRSEGGTALYGVSTTGSLVYVPGAESGIGGEQNLGLVDRAGKVDLLKLPEAAYIYPRFSPDGQQRLSKSTTAATPNIWVYDMSGASALRRLTFGGRNRVPAWSADGQRIAFQSDREGDLAIFSQRADGAGSAERRHDTGERHRSRSRVVVLQRRSAVQRDKGSGREVMDLLGHESDQPAVRLGPVIEAADQRGILTERPVGRLSI